MSFMSVIALDAFLLANGHTFNTTVYQNAILFVRIHQSVDGTQSLNTPSSLLMQFGYVDLFRTK